LLPPSKIKQLRLSQIRNRGVAGGVAQNYFSKGLDNANHEIDEVIFTLTLSRPKTDISILSAKNVSSSDTILRVKETDSLLDLKSKVIEEDETFNPTKDGGHKVPPSDGFVCHG
jgi:hypothetical protein